jgi:ABC-type sugar transport system permease subunit
LFFFLFTFAYYPAISGIYHSFFDWSDTHSSFIGFANFRELFTDNAVFLPSLLTMLKIIVPKILIGVIAPLLAALLIFNIKHEKAQGIYRLLILLPIVAPGVVGTLIWSYIYDPNYGLLTALFKLVGGQATDWLGNGNTVIPAIVFMGFPWIGGTAVLIYLSGLMSISISVRESARLDGAGGLTRLFRIDLPLITGQIRYFLIFGIIGGLQDYSVQFLITDGGPGNDSMVPGYYMYKQAFTSGRMGYACAVGTFLFLLTLIFTIISLRLGKRGGETV